MIDLADKKLLVLGGGPMWVDIVRNAQTLGVHTTVVDWHKDRKLSPAKDIAENSYDVSIFDIGAILEIIKKDNIDGVLTGYTDIVLPPYLEICKKAGLWCYGNEHQFLQLTDKANFKKLCRSCSIPTVEGVEIDYNNLNEAYEFNAYPVIVKPTDSCGARGIRVAHNKNELADAIEYAKSFSKSKRFIIEKYLERTTEFMACYTIANGEAALSALCDRFKSYEISDFSAVPLCQYYPSIHIDQYLEEIDCSVRQLINKINLKNCYLSIQGFFNSDHLYVNEAGFRLGGGQFYNFTEIINKTNTLKRMIRFALTGNMLSPQDSISLDNCRFDKICGAIFINARPGIIHIIDGIDNIKNEVPEVIHVMQQANVGDIIKSTGSLNHVVARIKLISPNTSSFADAVTRITSKVKVLDSNGASMMMEPLFFDSNGRPID